jgi:hypothetical protein
VQAVLLGRSHIECCCSTLAGFFQWLLFPAQPLSVASSAETPGGFSHCHSSIRHKIGTAWHQAREPQGTASPKKKWSCTCFHLSWPRLHLSSVQVIVRGKFQVTGRSATKVPDEYIEQTGCSVVPIRVPHLPNMVQLSRQVIAYFHMSPFFCPLPTEE